MNEIYGYKKLSKERKILILKSLTLMTFIRISLYLFSFSKLEKFLKKFSKPKNKKKYLICVEDIVWAVNVSSHHVPNASCLTKALTGHILFLRYEFDSNLRIGVFKSSEFEAHAWIEIDNKIVLGETDKDFIPLLNLD